MTVRPAGPGDAEAITRVHTLAWQVAYRGIVADEFLDAIDWERRAEGWGRILNSPDRGSVYVACRSSAVVGFAAVGQARDQDVSGYFELFSIYLAPDAWGSGLATPLLQAALGSARPVMLWVLADNLRARRFYEREGFALDGVSRVETLAGQELEEVRYVLS